MATKKHDPGDKPGENRRNEKSKKTLKSDFGEIEIATPRDRESTFEPLEELYGVEVSPTLISNETDAVLEEVRAWQSRPLDAVYPIVYLDALVVKMRDQGQVQNRAVYVAIGITMQGRKEVLRF